MGGQAAEQIIAGVVLSERLAITMYGAIHRAQFNGQRNLRGLVIDPKMLAENSFRVPLTDTKTTARILGLEHPNVVPTVGVESGGPDVVVVTRGGGRYVTVQDLITAARSRSKQGGKLSLPVAAAIGKSVVEALAAAHRLGVIHGAVHPRSVLVDEDGSVRLGDFVVGRALTTAVAQGADSAMWRGLAGYIAPELVVGENPTPAADVFACGAMLFTMLSGEVPPGSLRVTPAIERLVQRALDTDVLRRYKNAGDLLENLLEAIEDDRWDIAERNELVREAGLSRPDSNVDEATEDLLASLGSSSSNVQVSPLRASMEMRAEQINARQKTPAGSPKTGGRLDALLADLDEQTNVTYVDEAPVRDPISELIRLDPRKREAIVSSARVPSLDDPDEITPLPAPMPHHSRESEPVMRRPSSVGGGVRAGSADEAAAFAAIGELDQGARRVSSAAEAANAAVEKLEKAAARAEAAATRAETGGTPRPSTGEIVDAPKPKPQPQPRALPIPDIVVDDYTPPRLKSRLPGVIALLVLGGVGYWVYRQYNLQEDKNQTDKEKSAEAKAAAEEQEKLAAQQSDRSMTAGAIKVTSTPTQAGVWLKIGRTPVDTMPLSSEMMHEIRVENVDGFMPVDAQVIASNWTGDDKANRHGSITVTLKPLDKNAKPGATKLPAMPPKPPDATGFKPGRGPIHIESSPTGAEVWMYIGMTDEDRLNEIQAGLPYEVRVLKDGFLPGFTSFTPEEWRDGGDPKTPLIAAKKKPELDHAVELAPDPNAKPDKKPR